MIAVDGMVAAARTATEQDWRWASVVARDRAADGKFFYSVRTTGVYCRPSCAARLARPENVRFHLTRTSQLARAGQEPAPIHAALIQLVERPHELLTLRNVSEHT